MSELRCGLSASVSHRNKTSDESVQKIKTSREKKPELNQSIITSTSYSFLSPGQRGIHHGDRGYYSTTANMPDPEQTSP
jgi:hypothetical protein